MAIVAFLQNGVGSSAHAIQGNAADFGKAADFDSRTAAAALAGQPLSWREKSGRTTAFHPIEPIRPVSRTAGVDPGCAKTRAFSLLVESSSQFGQSENEKCWRRLSEEGNRENGSTLSWLAHVFTRPGPTADLRREERNLRDARVEADLSPSSDEPSAEEQIDRTGVSQGVGEQLPRFWPKPTRGRALRAEIARCGVGVPCGKRALGGFGVTELQHGFETTGCTLDGVWP